MTQVGKRFAIIWKVTQTGAKYAKYVKDVLASGRVNSNNAKALYIR